MANSAALIRESIWRDRDFRSLPRGAQCTYVQLCSQKDLDCAGLLTLNVGLLAKGCNDIDKETIRADLEVLEAHRFVFMDDETDELFIRSYMRTAQVVKSPNIFKSALKSAGMVESEKLRAEVASELRRLHRAEADKLANELNPSGSHRPDPTKGSGTLPENETLPEPSSTGTVSGLGSPSVVGHLGEENPRPKCSKHETNSEEACMACARRSKWDKAHPEYFALLAEQERKRKEAERVNCPRCFGESTYVGEDLQVRPCRPHLPAKESRHA